MNDNNMSCADDIEDVGFSWKVELEEGVNFTELESELQKNLLATGVDLCVHDSIAQIPCAEVVSFFNRLACSLNGLKRLECYPGAGSYNSFPIEALCAAVLESQNKLEVLYVYHLELYGDTKMFRAFADQLESCHALKEVCFIDCRLSSNHGFAFDPVVRALGSLKSLQVAALWADDLGHLTTDSLTKLCRSTTCERLMILGFDLVDPDISLVFNELSRNQSLRRLNISCSRIGTTGCRALSRMLQRNSKLEKLQIDLDVLEDEDDLKEVANGLRTNSTLNYLKLSGPSSGSSDMVDLQKAFESMLEHNFSLRSLSILDGEVSSPTMDLYLKLNCCGRQKVFHNSGGTTEWDPWLDALVHSNSDISCLFYFLSSTDHAALLLQ